MASARHVREPPSDDDVTGLLAPPPNMGAQPDRIDWWDAYVCRFPESDTAVPSLHAR